MSTIFDTTALSVSGVAATSDTGAAAESRAKVLEMTQTAEDAVLAPAETGAWSSDLRAALAARIARLNGDEDLALRYCARISPDAILRVDGEAALADPAETGAAQGLAPVVAFMDKVAVNTRAVAAEDIAALQGTGVADADIVRLCELNAFMAYQIRVIAGLRLMRGDKGATA